MVIITDWFCFPTSMFLFTDRTHNCYMMFAANLESYCQIESNSLIIWLLPIGIMTKYGVEFGLRPTLLKMKHYNNTFEV